MVRWSGGLGAEHSTLVVWNFNRDGHIFARVLSDSSPIPIGRSNAARLDEYFRQDLFPTVVSQLAD